MIGFKRNEESIEKTEPVESQGESLDFEKLRAELLTLESVERRDARDDYDRGHRSF